MRLITKGLRMREPILKPLDASPEVERQDIVAATPGGDQEVLAGR
jgi:hypothetical protein